jgi:hypothetical protein
VNGEDGVVARGGDKQDVIGGVQRQPRRAHDECGRITSVQVARGDLRRRCDSHAIGDPRSIFRNAEVETRHRSTQHVRDEYLGLGA